MRALPSLAIVLLAACGGDAAKSPATPTTPTTPVTPVTPTPAANAKDTIFTPGIRFSPNFVTVSAGATVYFALGFDGVGHDVRFTEKAGAPAYIPVSVRKYVGVVMTTKGDFPFICPTHPEMSGVITVQ